MNGVFAEMARKRAAAEVAAEKQREAVRGCGLTIASYLDVRELRAVFRGIPLVLAQDLTEGSTGGYLWAGSVRALEHVLSRGVLDAIDASPPRVLELGAGVGLASLVLALAGASVVATDRVSALPLLQRNVDAHAALLAADGAGDVRVLAHAWGEVASAELQREVDLGFDLIVACDCVYATHAVKPLIASMRALSSRSRTKLIVANAQRTALEVWLRSARPHFDVDLLAEGRAAPAGGAADGGAGGEGRVERERGEEDKVRVYVGERC